MGGDRQRDRGLTLDRSCRHLFIGESLGVCLHYTTVQQHPFPLLRNPAITVNANINNNVNIIVKVQKKCLRPVWCVVLRVLHTVVYVV